MESNMVLTLRSLARGMKRIRVRGHGVRRTWQYDPTLYAPARYRRACSYEAFIPDELAEFQLEVPGHVAGIVSEAENAIAALNAIPVAALAPLGPITPPHRIQSRASKVEGLQVDARALGRAEGNLEAGRRDLRRSRKAGKKEILANIEAMELAVENATARQALASADIDAVHEGPDRAGRTDQGARERLGLSRTGLAATTTTPVEPITCRRHTEEVARLVDDLCAYSSGDDLPPLIQAAIAHAQFDDNPAPMWTETEEPAVPWCRSFFAGGDWRLPTCRRSAWSWRNESQPTSAGSNCTVRTMWRLG